MKKIEVIELLNRIKKSYDTYTLVEYENGNRLILSNSNPIYIDEILESEPQYLDDEETPIVAIDPNLEKIDDEDGDDVFIDCYGDKYLGEFNKYNPHDGLVWNAKKLY